MPYEEYRKWLAFFDQKPIGWREDLRTYLYLKTQGVKEKPEIIFPSLKPILGQERTIGGTLRTSGFFQKMIGAKGGDNILELIGEK